MWQTFFFPWLVHCWTFKKRYVFTLVGSETRSLGPYGKAPGLVELESKKKAVKCGFGCAREVVKKNAYCDVQQKKNRCYLFKTSATAFNIQKADKGDKISKIWLYSYSPSRLVISCSLINLTKETWMTWKTWQNHVHPSHHHLVLKIAYCEVCKRRTLNCHLMADI